MNTILITGCSSGFGLETARLFLDRGWTVVATMRTPREDVLPRSGRLRILPLDVTDQGSIARAVEAFPQAEEIFEKNIETMEQLGHDGWDKLHVGPA